MDFLKIEEKYNSYRVLEIYPVFIIGESKDLMIRGNNFYAFWDEERQEWSRNENRCTQLIDQELKKYVDEKVPDGMNVSVKYMKYSNTKSTDAWKTYIKKLSTDHFTPLDGTLVFSNTERKRELYSSHSLPYALAPGDYSAYDELVSVLYDPEERNKLEWIIGSIVTGASKRIQKFIVLTGDPGSGKGTIINIICKLFEGYTSVIDAEALGNPSASFPLESLKDNPLVAYEGDTKLNKIKSNTKLNSLISHEPLEVNEKYAKKYSMKFDCMLILGSNDEVKITDARSGLLRRLIDVRPTGKTVDNKRYNRLMRQIEFELGAIAWHCKEVFESDPEKYLGYRPTRSIRATNYTYNFLEENYLEYKDGVSLKRMWLDYQQYCEDAGIDFKLNRIELKGEASAYFESYIADGKLDDGTRVYNYFKDIKPEKFGMKKRQPEKVEPVEEFDSSIPEWLRLKAQHSLLDDEFKDFPAQYAKIKNGREIPLTSWDNVKTTLKDIDTSKMHYVLPDDVYVELDLDLKDDKGQKNYDLNVKAAAEFPATYAETSKSGQALHLVYKYTGDPSELNLVVDDDIEIKVHLGKASMRRKLTTCNDVPIKTISSGLPLKGAKKKVFDSFVFKNARHLRNSILKNLRMENVPYHGPSVSLIYKDLEEAYAQGFEYDVSDLAGVIYDFGQESHNQKKNCAELVAKMKFKSKHYEEPGYIPEGTVQNPKKPKDASRICIFDIEVYPNFFGICYGYVDDPDNIVGLKNPDAATVKALFDNNYIGGFNNRRYDNIICYARTLGYSNKACYELSQRIINKERNVGFGPAKDISDFDVWDMASNKQSLKKWEIQLKMDHVEMDIPWDQPVPDDRIDDVIEYCKNDVRATIAVYAEIKADIECREMLSELSGLTINHSNREHITKILVGDEQNPVHVYTDLATGKQTPDDIPGIYKPGEIIMAFPGYEYVDGKNMFRGTDVGKGGYVYYEPGVYTNVALLDVGNMHGASILALNKFGVYTKNYKMIRDARMAIKHHDYETAAKMFDGKLAKYLGSDEEADKLQQALKLILNSTYGIAAATFKNPLRDPKDVNNIIALRGALFMRTLQDEVQDRGFTVAHIKTDSIKIPNATPEIIEFVMEFGRKYGYEFEHEATYTKMCLVNGSTYIAKYDEFGNRTKGGKHANEWTATAKQFQVPYVFKKLFSHEPIEFDDLCETKSVQEGALYLDQNENLPEDEHNLVFVGRVGRFCPMKDGCGAGILYRIKDGKYYAATGTKGYRWMESHAVQNLGLEDQIDRSYYDTQVNDAVKDISKFCDFTWFTSDDPLPESYDFYAVPNDPLEGNMNKPET